MGEATLLGVDWGTTRLRVALLDAAGTVLERRDSDDGLMAVSPGGFEAALASASAGLNATGLPVLMSGMVGSAQGWREAPYIDVAATAGDLAGAILPVGEVAGAPIGIVPGVCTGRAEGPGDVMRGEETEIFGALHVLGRDGGTFVLPGTHTKWASVEEGAITAFHTFMTGDLFNAVAKHTVLSKTVTAAGDDLAAFDRGVAMAGNLSAVGDLTCALFSLRAENLFGRLSAAQTPEALSGLLIGAEVRSGLSRASGAITVVGGAVLAPRYRRAIAALGGSADIAPPDCAMIGLAQLASLAGATRFAGARS